MLLMLLMAGSMGEAWGKVTYHILTLPFKTQQRPYSGKVVSDDPIVYMHGGNYVRVEALRCSSNDLTVGLPEYYKSPLAKNFRYYMSNRVSEVTNQQLYGYNDATFSLYYLLQDDGSTPTTDNADYADSQTAAGTVLAEGNYDIYVTYEYDPDNGILDLTGTKEYNILMDANNSVTRFLCYNKDRNNRPGGMRLSKLSDHWEYLASDEFCYIKDGVTNGKHNYHFIFRFIGPKWEDGGVQMVPDPYNITIETAYTGSEYYSEQEKNLNKKTQKEYKGASIFSLLTQTGSAGNNMWLSSEDDVQWTSTASPESKDVPGYFRGSDGSSKHSEMCPIFNSVTVLNHINSDGTFAFAGTKLNQKGNGNTVVQPNNSGQDAYFMASDDNNIMLSFKNASEVDHIQFYEVKRYTYKVKTPFYDDAAPADKDNHVVSATVKWSDYKKTLNVMDHIPDALQRKYVHFDNTYKQNTYNDVVTTFAEADANSDVVWVKYSTTASLPFTVSTSTDPQDLTPYNILVNKENRYATWYDDSDDRFYSRDPVAPDDGHSIYDGESHFFFVGDPYELYVMNEDAIAALKPYMVLDDGSNPPAIAGSSVNPGTKVGVWEIVYDDNTGSNEGCFKLRQYKTSDSPVYLGRNGGESLPLIGTDNVDYVVRLMIQVLPVMEYTYYIIDHTIDPESPSYPHIAVKATVKQPIGYPLNYDAIPEAIRSPFLQGGTLTFKTYATDAKTSLSAAITATNVDRNSEYKNHIFVEYTSLPALLKNPLVDDGDDSNDHDAFNVVIDGQCIYYSGGSILSKPVAEMTNEESISPAFLWILDGGDPYAFLIRNKGAAAGSQYVQIADLGTGVISWVGKASATKFVIKSSNASNTYEVMYATGTSVDASTTYYNIGRPEANVVKLYSNASYEYGDHQLRFQMMRSTARTITYHLIDMQGKDLLQVDARHADNDTPVFPPDYWSPLVAEYSYYVPSDFNKSGETHTLKLDATKLTDVGKESDVPAVTDIYVTYTARDIVDMNHTTMYLLKFFQGETFYQENGSDDRLTDEQYADPRLSKAVYPYCNGDGNFNIYGQYQYDLQQEGAASTRTRWAWYVESGDNDPYHVKIMSRQTETYNGLERSAYFATMKPDDYDKVITTLVWPNISGVQATDYMVLGSEGRYQLVTSYKIDGERYVVNSFEQYWKTYDAIKKKFLKDLLDTYATDPSHDTKVTDDTSDGFIEVPESPASLREKLTGTGEGQYGFHSYSKMAYAKRWNGYNASGEKKKGWESREHWFQTVSMGSGYFDFVKVTIDPALILLDQHGWEIMRKPIPTSPDEDPAEKARKYAAIRAYDSPMVKEYIFWSSAKKRSGLHQYYALDKRIGGDFTSTTLTQLPPFDSENVHDTKGNLNDQYVTYIVKDEYAQSILPGMDLVNEFIIQQGDYIAKNDGTSTVAKVDVTGTGGVSQYIIDHIADPNFNTVLWCLKPNTDIDTEMGYTASNHSWTEADADNPNAYEDATSGYSTALVADLVVNTPYYLSLSTEDRKSFITKYGLFTFSNGFDPYNIQIYSKTGDIKYFTIGMTSAEVQEGVIIGGYSGIGGTTDVTLADKNASPVSGDGYDNSHFKMTNQTFMAVQDADGNMQLMPRFDHTLRMQDFSTLVTPDEDGSHPEKLPKTYTKLYRPLVYNYHIIDNDGNESLRYQSGGDLQPQTPAHFQSPLAKDFTYYKTLKDDDSDGVYELESLADELTESTSLLGAGLAAGGVNNNHVYVRYVYDQEADVQHILLGKWLTMQLNAKDTKYDSGIKQGTSKPTPVDGNDDKAWQWKFLENPYTAPDPYAVQVFNRSMAKGAEVPTDTRFALLSHTSGGYALAQAGLESLTYKFLDGSAMNTTTAATIEAEADFKSTSCSFTGTNAQVLLIDDVNNTYTYKVYTNGGVQAVEAGQSNAEALSNDFEPFLPDAARSPLLKPELFRYYEELTDTAANSGKSLQYLYGLYDGYVYVRYDAYDPTNTTYKVPNAKTVVDSHVARDASSNDTPLRLDGTLPYNIIWYNDNMMKNDGGDVKATADMALSGDADYVWFLDGNDPYAIKIKSKGADKHITTSLALNEDGEHPVQTFMLLPQAGYEYGVLAKTGTAGNMLTMPNATTLEVTTTEPQTYPQQFMIFTLSTYSVIYHLVIDNIGRTVSIPYRETVSGTLRTKSIQGTTLRDLTSKLTEEGIAGDKYQVGQTIDGQTNCIDAGPISLGDPLTITNTPLYRPNVVYTFFVQNIKKNTGGDTWVDDEDMNNKYKGVIIDPQIMFSDEDLLGKKIYINVVYSFNGNLDSNNGDGFVLSVNENKWYTLEMSDTHGTPWLAQYTNAWGFELKEGRGSHYTNDFLWTPIGDPYGFQLYNRYMDINSGSDNRGEKNKVVTTDVFLEADGVSPAVEFGEGQQVIMGDCVNGGVTVRPGKSAKSIAAADIKARSIYELLEGTKLGYFRFHPVANNTGTQYYFSPDAEADDDGDGVNNVLVRLSSTAAEFTFGLSKDLMKPYFDRAGYVGGLKKSVYDELTANSFPDPEDAGKINLKRDMEDENATLSAAQLRAAQTIVYQLENIVSFETGYYRLHSPLGISEINPVRYASGYTHKLERDQNGDGNEADAIPMHFYELNSSQKRTYIDLREGFTYSHATRGDLPILPVNQDPASIFYFERLYPADNRNNLGYMSTQGLYVKGTVGTGVEESAGVKAKAVMTANSGEAVRLFVMDIGGGILLIHDNQTANGRVLLKYLSFDQADGDIYDLKLTHNTHTDHAKWCMQPVQTGETSGVNEMNLQLEMHKGGDKNAEGDDYYYSTFCVPFDVLMTDAAADEAFICKQWDEEIIHLNKVGKMNTAANGCPERFRGDNRFIPAGTPVIIRSTHDVVSMALPTTTPTATIPGCVFSGQYLEQLLDKETHLTNSDVYVFGLPFNPKVVKKHDDYASDSENNGVISIELPQPSDKGVGFYINANPNRETGASLGEWIRNNRYVYNNRIYYRPGFGGLPAPRQTRSVDYIPVDFDDDEDETSEDMAPHGPMDNHVYDLQGRCVATPQQVISGNWQSQLSPGIYILNGKKVRVPSR